MKKKGFTLIELLAVIVILAIIALIATPIILGVIDDAKRGAAKSSALGYIDAVEKYIALNQMDDTAASKENLTQVFTRTDVSVKGTKPTAVSINFDKGVVTAASVSVNGYTVTMDANGSVTVK